MASLDLSLAFDVVKNFNERNSCMLINDLSNINSYRHVLKDSFWGFKLLGKF